MFYKKDGVYFSDILTCPHGFSCREGGVSTHTHTASMNLAFGRGDDDATVIENLSIFAGKLGIDEKSIISVPQIHSCDVRAVGEEQAGMGYFREAEFSCDGYVTREKGVAIGVKTADCVPILLYDPVSSVIGALHAGWRGSTAGIALAGLEKMISLGAKAQNIRAAIGAAIGKCCYEVGEDVYNAARENLGEDIADRFIMPSGDKYRADLKGLNAALLVQGGVLPENIDISEHCTACESGEFFSHRATGGLRGTMLSVISL